MIGVGITPEGIFQNYVMYEFALEQAWNRHKVDVSRWIEQYAFARYGFYNDQLNNAWHKLRVSYVQILILHTIIQLSTQNILLFCSTPCIHSTDWSI